jgi:hypothetical protein
MEEQKKNRIIATSVITGIAAIVGLLIAYNKGKDGLGLFVYTLSGAAIGLLPAYGIGGVITAT